MVLVPRDATDQQVLEIIHEWIDAFSREDYAAVFDAVGYLIVGEESQPEAIEADIKRYRSPEYYPGVEDFVVTDWRTAHGGNPEPRREVTWYEPNSINLCGAVAFDLPLNGRWSDLTADFVFFGNSNPEEGYLLFLEEISSWKQTQRDMEAWDADAGAEAVPPA